MCVCVFHSLHRFFFTKLFKEEVTSEKICILLHSRPTLLFIYLFLLYGETNGQTTGVHDWPAALPSRYIHRFCMNFGNLIWSLRFVTFDCKQNFMSEQCDLRNFVHSLSATSKMMPLTFWKKRCKVEKTTDTLNTFVPPDPCFTPGFPEASWHLSHVSPVTHTWRTQIVFTLKWLQESQRRSVFCVTLPVGEQTGACVWGHGLHKQLFISLDSRGHCNSRTLSHQRWAIPSYLHIDTIHNEGGRLERIQGSDSMMFKSV